MSKRILVLLVSVVFVFGACGGGGDDEAADTDAGSGATDDTTAEDAADGGGGTARGITIEGFKFSLANAAAGASVPVVNEDGSAHTATADNGEFDSGEVEGGGEGSITAPDKPGQYPFHCEIHPSMKGTLTVTG